MDRSRVLLVDDDPGLLRLLSYRLRSAGYDVEAVDSGDKALGRLPDFEPQVVITDLRMDGMDGMALFDTIHAERPQLPVIILTAHGTIPDAVAATQRGLHGFFTKPCDSERLLGCVDKAVRLSGAPDAGVGDPWQRTMVGRHPAMQSLLESARVAARSDAGVVVCGPAGAGKTLLARTLHANSGRSDGPLVTVDANAGARDLLDSELFGEAGRRGGGALSAARGGTLLIEGLCDLPAHVQARLVDRLGDMAKRADAPRLVATAQRDPDKAVADGALREDLACLFNVVTLHVPALSERREDIPLLIRHFAGAKTFSPDAMDAMLGAAWPGNVRQLEHTVSKAVTMCTAPIVPKSSVDDVLQAGARPLPTLNDARKTFEKQYLVRVLRSTRGNVSHAARLAGRDRSKFYKLLHRHELDPAHFRRPR